MNVNPHRHALKCEMEKRFDLEGKRTRVLMAENEALKKQLMEM
jgi:hypothetical protein